MAEISHKYQLEQICVFTNRLSSDVIKNDGKRCKIVRLKPKKEWAYENEPEYVIHFLNENHGFGVRECELEPITKKEENHESPNCY